MERFINCEKDFIGKAGTTRSREAGPRTLLAYLEVDAQGADCLGSEPVYCGASLAGVTTSGAYGFAVKKSLAFAYLEPRLVTPGLELTVLVRGEPRPARVLEEPAWDRNNERLRA